MNRGNIKHLVTAGCRTRAAAWTGREYFHTFKNLQQTSRLPVPSASTGAGRDEPTSASTKKAAEFNPSRTNQSSAGASKHRRVLGKRRRWSLVAGGGKEPITGSSSPPPGHLTSACAAGAPCGQRTSRDAGAGVRADVSCSCSCSRSRSCLRRLPPVRARPPLPQSQSATRPQHLGDAQDVVELGAPKPRSEPLESTRVAVARF